MPLFTAVLCRLATLPLDALPLTALSSAALPLPALLADCRLPLTAFPFGAIAACHPFTCCTSLAVHGVLVAALPVIELWPLTLSTAVIANCRLVGYCSLPSRLSAMPLDLLHFARHSWLAGCCLATYRVVVSRWLPLIAALSVAAHCLPVCPPCRLPSVNLLCCH